MIGIIGYGSLVNCTQHVHQKELLVDTVPIKLRSYKRIFNQRPTWRKATSTKAAVLNAHYSESDWLNAVCYCYEDFNFIDLDHRERGYSRTAVATQSITCYQGKDLPPLTKLFIYLGKTENRDDTLLPNSEYLKICLTGAKSWGDDFYRDFLTTTYINHGILLREYVNTDSLRIHK